jgi:hypothetical protein
VITVSSAKYFGLVDLGTGEQENRRQQEEEERPWKRKSHKPPMA